MSKVAACRVHWLRYQLSIEPTVAQNDQLTTEPGFEMTMNSRSLSMCSTRTGSLATGGSWRCTVLLIRQLLLASRNHGATHSSLSDPFKTYSGEAITPLIRVTPDSKA